MNIETNMPTIVCFGECMVELRSAPQSAQQIGSDVQITQSFAGDVFNTCVYLKRLFNDINVEFATQIGVDALSQNMIDMFEREDIGHQFVTRDEQRSPGLYWITTDDSGERSFTYWRDNSAARFHTQAMDENDIEKLAKYQWLFISGISLAVIKPHLRDVFWNMIKQLKVRGVNVIFDPNYRPNLWQSPSEAKAQYDLAFTHSDMALPGVEDMDALYQLDNMDAIIAFLSKFDIDEIVIKNGSENVYVFADDLLTEVKIEPVKQVVDTTSAGDSFNGAYIGCRLNNMAVTHSVNVAAQVAGFVIQHSGAIVDCEKFKAFQATLEALK